MWQIVNNMIPPQKVAHHPSIYQDIKTHTTIMIALNTTTFLMDLHKHAKDLNAFLTFGIPYNYLTQIQGSHCENECDLFWCWHNFPPFSWGKNIKLWIDARKYPFPTLSNSFFARISYTSMLVGFYFWKLYIYLKAICFGVGVLLEMALVWRRGYLMSNQW